MRACPTTCGRVYLAVRTVPHPQAWHAARNPVITALHLEGALACHVVRKVRRLDSDKFASLYLWKPCLPYVDCLGKPFCGDTYNVKQEAVTVSGWTCTDDVCCGTTTKDYTWRATQPPAYPNQNNTQVTISFDMEYLKRTFFVNNEPNATKIQQILIPFPGEWIWNSNQSSCSISTPTVEITPLTSCNLTVVASAPYVLADISSVPFSTEGSFSIHLLNVATPSGVVNSPPLPMHFVAKLPSFDFRVYTSTLLVDSLKAGGISQGVFTPHNVLSQAVDNATLQFSSSLAISQASLLRLNFSQSGFNFIDSSWFVVGAPAVPIAATYDDKLKLWVLILPFDIPANATVNLTVTHARNPEATFKDTFASIPVDVLSKSSHGLVATGVITATLVHDVTASPPSGPYNWISLVLLVLSLMFCLLMLFKHGLFLFPRHPIALFSDITAVASVLGLLLGVINNAMWVAGSNVFFYMKCGMSSLAFTMLLSVCFHWGAVLSPRIRKLPTLVTLVSFLGLNVLFYTFQLVVAFTHRDVIGQVYSAEMSVNMLAPTYPCKDGLTFQYVFSDIQPFYTQCYLSHLNLADVHFFTWFSNTTYSIFALLTIGVLGLGWMVMRRGSKILHLISYSPQQIYLMKALRLYTALIGLVTCTYLLAFAMQFVQSEVPYYWWYLTTVWLPQCIPPCCFIFLQWNSATKSLRKDNDERSNHSKEVIVTPRIVSDAATISPIDDCLDTINDPSFDRSTMETVPPPTVGLSLRLMLPETISSGCYVAVETQAGKWQRVASTDTMVPEPTSSPDMFVVSFLSVAHVDVRSTGAFRFLVFSARDSLHVKSSSNGSTASTQQQSHHHATAASALDGLEYLEDDTDSDEDEDDPLLQFLQPTDRCISSFTVDAATLFRNVDGGGLVLEAASGQCRLHGTCVLHITFVHDADLMRRNTTLGGAATAVGKMVSSQYHLQDQGILVVEDLMESPFSNVMPGQYLDIIVARRTKAFWQAEQDLQQFVALEHARMHQDASMGTLYENLLEQIQDEADRRQCRDWLQERVQVRKEYVAMLHAARQTAWKRERDRNRFKPSTAKKDPALAFLPLNLHLQEMHVLATNDQVYETTTVGAFAAHMYKFKQGGVFSLQQEADKCKPVDVPSLFPSTWQYLSQVERRRGDLAWTIDTRLDMCVPQALATLVTAFCSRIHFLLDKPARFERMLHAGFIFHVESLLSTYGAELGMLEDMMVAMDTLGRFRFLLVSDGGDLPAGASRSGDDGESWTSSITSVDLYSNVEDALLGNRTHEHAKSEDEDFVIRVVVRSRGRVSFPRRCLVAIHPILFNIGINEKQTLANMSAAYPKKLQDHINDTAVTRLKPLVQSHCEHAPGDDLAPRLLKELIQAVYVSNASRKKHPEVLQLSSRLVRHLDGGRVTVCKSAKDRTGMSVTLEQGMILNWHHELPSSKMAEVVATMRTRGVRIENTLKNTGRRRFAFNALQRSMMPEQYRCPPEAGGRNMS
ncbi:hypothetical protein LEN26_009523 [Aphanomyces euteiches]|nr:hypothetical protein LEN26_009523 [Aphanomyces euteiches]